MLAHLSKVTNRSRSDSVGSEGASKREEKQSQKERERKLRLERAARALLLQSKQRLTILIQRRKSAFQYLKRIHGK